MKRRSNTFSDSHFQVGGFPRKVPSTTAYTPLAESDISFYWDPDAVGTGTLSAITDQSSGGHNLSQATAGKRAVNTAAQFGTHRGLVFPVAASHGGYLFDAEWLQPAACTCYAIVKYVATGSTHQMFWCRRLAGEDAEPLAYLNGGATANRPSVNTSSTICVSSSALVDATTYLIKWAWDIVGNANYVALNGGAAATTVNDSIGGGHFVQLGLSSANVQDLCSVVGPMVICSALHNGDAEDTRITNYLKTWAGLP